MALAVPNIPVGEEEDEEYDSEEAEEHPGCLACTSRGLRRALFWKTFTLFVVDFCAFLVTISVWMGHGILAMHLKPRRHLRAPRSVSGWGLFQACWRLMGLS